MHCAPILQDGSSVNKAQASQCRNPLLIRVDLDAATRCTTLFNHKQPTSDLTGSYARLTPERLGEPQWVEDRLLRWAKGKRGRYGTSVLERRSRTVHFRRSRAAEPKRAATNSVFRNRL
jgi:hypothetical protein